MNIFGHKHSKFVFWGILSIAFFLRILFLAKFPIGFTPDEASFGYDAYSLIKTGKDQWGNFIPLTFKSFGDSKLPLYTYLTIPFVALFGLTEASTRMASAIIGTLAVLSTFLMTFELFKEWQYKKFTNYHLAILASFLLAISPWHLALSRGAFEANLTVFFMSSAVWAFLKSFEKPKYLVYSAILFGLNLFSYHSARLVTPLVMGFLAFSYKEELKSFKKKNLKMAGAIFSVFFLVAAYQFLAVGSSRASDITIFNPTDKWMSVFERRVGAVFAGLSDPIARIFSNKYFYVLDRFINNYLTYFSPQFLFTLGPSEWTYGMIAGRGVLYLFELVFTISLIGYLVRRGVSKSKGLKVLLFWLFVGAVPAALTKGAGYAGNRAAVIMPSLQILSAMGGLVAFSFLRNKIGKKFTSILYFLVITISLVFFLEDYVFHAPRDGAGGMLSGRKEAIDYVIENEDLYKEIIVSRTISEPQIYVAFYTQYPPDKYQEATRDWLRFEEEGLAFLDQLGEYSLGKYIFKNINFIDDAKLPKTLLVGKPLEFPFEISPLKTIELPNKEPAIIIFGNNL